MYFPPVIKYGVGAIIGAVAVGVVFAAATASTGWVIAAVGFILTMLGVVLVLYRKIRPRTIRRR